MNAPEVPVPAAKGKAAPIGLIPDTNGYGYGRFTVDDRSLGNILTDEGIRLSPMTRERGS